MKYDLKYMNFVPNAKFLHEAFVWSRSLEGHKYWEKQAKNGPDKDALKRWEQMEDQANEEGFNQ